MEFQNEIFGASRENRTPMSLRSVDFESTASTNSAREARHRLRRDTGNSSH